MLLADRTFFNGKIYTMKNEGDNIEALVLYDGKILFAGSNEDALKFHVKEKIDLKGKTVIPGFSDTHLHFVMDCEFKQKVNLVNARSFGEIIEKMYEKEKELSEGQWLLGANLHVEKLKEGRFPTCEELDLISKKRPIAINSYCAHAALVNNRALELAGIGKEYVPKVKGTIEFDDEGNPTGITRETVYSDIFAPIIGNILGNSDQKKAAMIKVFNEYSRYGITTVHTFSSLSGDPLEYIYNYKELDEEGKLPVRIILNSTADIPKDIGVISGFGNDKVKYGAKKIFCDGSLSSRSAALTEPYSDAPDQYGLLIFSQEEMNRQVKEAYDYGMEVAIHAIGDRAMETVLNAIENAYDPNIKHNNRFRIEHAILINESHIERLKKLPVILDVQPTVMRNWMDIAKPRVGERAKMLFHYKTLMDNGIILTGGTDAPVEEVNPMIGIQCAVTRQTLDGYPEQGFFPEERLSVYEAVSMYTKNAAYCTNEEKKKGTLEVGKLADFIILGRDIFKTPHNEIHKINVESTILGGETVINS